MLRRAAVLPFLLLCPLFLWGCASGPAFVAKYEPWRENEERACLASGAVRETPFLTARSALGGPSVCGAARPFVMTAALGGYIQLKPAAVVRCAMAPQIERWVADVVDPAARRYLRASVVEMTVAASYSCRAQNGIYGGRLSEHGYANALDISAFILDDGRKITVRQGWTGGLRERAFLAAVHDGACAHFTTVLGPDHDHHHADHFHVDLARHGRDGKGRICK